MAVIENFWKAKANEAGKSEVGSKVSKGNRKDLTILIISGEFNFWINSAKSFRFKTNVIKNKFNICTHLTLYNDLYLTWCTKFTPFLYKNTQKSPFRLPFFLINLQCTILKHFYDYVVKSLINLTNIIGAYSVLINTSV